MSRSGAQNLVACHELSVSYGEVQAVREVTFTVAAGEVFALLGPNGAGKTSVVRALTTIVRPTNGTATICAVPLTEPSRVRRHIGVLPESNGYPGAQTALAYLTFYGQLFGMTAKDAHSRSTRLLDRFGLGPNLHQEIRTFSRGMRQRLGITRALINQPRVLFLDEPTIGLDPAGREDVLAHLVDVARDSKAAVVICSHLLDDIERTCDRVAIMHLGRLTAVGTVPEVAASTNVAATAKVVVPPAQVPEVMMLLETSTLDCHPVSNPARQGEIAITFNTPLDSANPLADLLLQHGVSILRLELRTTSLHDAFLAYTAEVPS